VYVLLNNAAIQVNKTVEETPVEDWNREIAINIGGVFLCSKFFLPHLRKTRGNIISMSSVNGFCGTDVRRLLRHESRHNGIDQGYGHRPRQGWHSGQLPLPGLH
jgi:NAD(P)-dependent dehydrogenase (short-subunit alcohol dehydrogenase family)